MPLPQLYILAPFLAALLIPFVYRYVRKIHVGWFVLSVPVCLFIGLIQYLPRITAGETITQALAWIPSLQISFTVYVDGLSLLFSLLITGIGSLVVLYSIYYLETNSEGLHRFYVYLLLFMGAMLGIVFSDNIIVFYVFWELTSLASFLLIAYWYTREKSRYGALKSLLITVFGGFAMLIGFLLLAVAADTYSIRELISQSELLTSHPVFKPAMILILLGAFTKSAQFPFHIWLPDAMEAPTPVSAYLHSATMVKAGLFLVARFTPLFAGAAEWFWLVSGFGLMTLFWGAFNAVRQTDLKSLLAFSTVSQLGLIMCLLGLGSAAVQVDTIEAAQVYSIAILAAVFHLINHATFKGGLFMVVGIIDHETGTRDMRRLGGLLSFMPITFTIALIGTFSMAGLPPFNGFLSKEMFFTAVLNISELNVFQLDTWGLIFPILAWIASVFTFIYSMLLLFRTFTGKYQPTKLQKKPREASLGMLIPPLILSSLVIIFGLFPNILTYTVIEPAMASILPQLLSPEEQFTGHIEMWHGWTRELYMTMGIVGVGIFLLLTLHKWIRLYDLFPRKLTLNEGYQRGLINMELWAGRLTSVHMTGHLRHYFIYIFFFFVLIMGSALYVLEAVHFDFENIAPIGLHEIVLGIVMVLATLTVALARSRMAAVISLGVVGYILALFFVNFRAPDLALTQLIVETISVSLLLLCFYFFPELRLKSKQVRFKLTNFLIAVSVGIIVTLLAISAFTIHSPTSISEYFVESSYTEAGGKNIVNVILVDFRGFDTLLEILVLGIASLGIFALIKLRLSEKRGISDENQ